MKTNGPRTDARQAFDLPELIRLGLGASASETEGSRGACLFGFGHASASVQFAADASAGHPFLAIAASDERIPGWLGEGRDAVLVSYTGEDPGILSVYEALRGRGCSVHCVSSGGRLAEMCEEDGNDLVRTPSGMTPRSAVGAEMGALASLLKSVGAPYIHDSIAGALDGLAEYRDGLLEDGSAVERMAGLIAGRTPAVYSPAGSMAAAKRWKRCLDEDTGRMSFYGEIPDFDHNEIVGWSDLGSQTEGLLLILLRTATGIPEYEYNMDCMIEVLQEYGRGIEVLDYNGGGIQAELRAMLFGDAVSAEAGRTGRRSE